MKGKQIFEGGDDDRGLRNLKGLRKLGDGAQSTLFFFFFFFFFVFFFFVIIIIFFFLLLFSISVITCH
nr:unnamed protein product [Spirometra erinaceieuropaei]